MWITPKGTTCDFETSENADDDTRYDDFHSVTFDHAFTIIKHNRDKYQLISGYQKNGDFEAIDFKTWLMSGNTFASGAGISRVEVNGLIDRLLRFANCDDGFDADNYKMMFEAGHEMGVGKDVWPSFYFHELDEDSIYGYGCRELALEVEGRLASEE